MRVLYLCTGGDECNVALRGARGRALAGALALYGKGCAAAAASPLPSLDGVTLMHVPVVSLGRLGGAE